jgi:hypothetical protein
MMSSLFIKNNKDIKNCNEILITNIEIQQI